MGRFRRTLLPWSVSIRNRPVHGGRTAHSARQQVASQLKKKKIQNIHHQDICQSSIYLLEKKNRSSRKKEKSIIETLKKNRSSWKSPTSKCSRTIIYLFEKNRSSRKKRKNRIEISIDRNHLSVLLRKKPFVPEKKIKPTLNHLSLVRLINWRKKTVRPGKKGKLVSRSLPKIIILSVLLRKNRSSRKKVN